MRLKLHYGDLTDATNLIRIIQQVKPTEIYNLAAQSHVAVSFETPEYTANADAVERAVNASVFLPPAALPGERGGPRTPRRGPRGSSRGSSAWASRADRPSSARRPC